VSTRLEVRVYGEEELTDVDPAKAAELLAAVPGVAKVDVSDDRHSDAYFATLYLTLARWDPETRAALDEALRALPRMWPRLVDALGYETELDDAVPEDWEKARH
jgi:hypothetical protein